MDTNERPLPPIIRSEITHEQEIALVHPAPPRELSEQIANSLKALEQRSSAPQQQGGANRRQD